MTALRPAEQKVRYNEIYSIYLMDSGSIYSS